MAPTVEDYAKYSEVADATAVVQRRLLQDGDAQQRVWAAWALGMAAGGVARPELVSAARTAPDAGTRRQLAIVLAGLQERGILTAWCVADPDPHVRAISAELLLRVEGPTQWRDLIRDRFVQDPSDEIRLRLIRSEALPFSDLAGLVEPMLSVARDSPVRDAAIERVLRESGGGYDPALLPVLASDSDGGARLRETLIDSLSAEPFFSLLRDGDPGACGPLRKEVVSGRITPRFTFEETPNWARKNDPLVVAALVQTPYTAMFREWLLVRASLVRASLEPGETRLGYEDEEPVLDRMVAHWCRIKADCPWPLTADEERVVAVVTAAIEREDADAQDAALWGSGGVDPYQAARQLAFFAGRDPGAVELYWGGALLRQCEREASDAVSLELRNGVRARVWRGTCPWSNKHVPVMAAVELFVPIGAMWGYALIGGSVRPFRWGEPEVDVDRVPDDAGAWSGAMTPGDARFGLRPEFRDSVVEAAENWMRVRDEEAEVSIVGAAYHEVSTSPMMLTWVTHAFLSIARGNVRNADQLAEVVADSRPR